MKWLLLVVIVLSVIAIPDVRAKLSSWGKHTKRLYIRDPIRPDSKYIYELAIATVFQQEAPYLKEWIEYHKLLGVQHFYMFNNQSSDDYQQVLQPYIDNGEIELIQWDFVPKNYPDWIRIQCEGFEHAIQLSYGKAKWLALIDTDEFLLPTTQDSLTAFLKDYTQYGSVSLNWQMYGTSDVSKIPADKLLIETLLWKAAVDHKTNYHVKSIVRPETVAFCYNPHFVIHKLGYYQVDANKERFWGPLSPTVLIDKARINHYWSRDEHYYYGVKLARQTTWGYGKSNVNQRVSQELNANEDKTIFRFVPSLRKIMELKNES